MKKKKNLLARKENLLARLNFWWPRASGRRLMRRLCELELIMKIQSTIINMNAYKVIGAWQYVQHYIFLKQNISILIQIILEFIAEAPIDSVGGGWRLI